MTVPRPPQGEMDFETYSEAGHIWSEAANKWGKPPGAGNKKGLSIVGAAVYSEHPSTEVLTLSYQLPAVSWAADGQARYGGEKRRWRPGRPLPRDLFDFLAAGGVMEAHNVMFERLIWENVCVPKYGFPPLPPYQLRCNMATARVNSYPGALGNLSDVLALPTPKDADGKRLLEKFSVPRNPTIKDPRRRITVADDPADAERLYGYCDTDLDAEKGAADRMAPMTQDELYFWFVDQEINWRGIAIDRAAVRDCIAVMDLLFETYQAECAAITGGLSPSQGAALQGWLAAQGVYLPDMQAETIRRALGGSLDGLLDEPDDIDPEEAQAPARELPAVARRVLEIRALTASASVKKLYAMENQGCRDDRLRNLIVHHGARTGRPIGEGPQPLNMPRGGPELAWCRACTRPFRPDHRFCPWCSAQVVPPPPPAQLTSKWPAVPKDMPKGTPAAIETVLLVMSWRSLELVEWFLGDALLCISGCVRGLFVAAPGHDLIASDYSSIEAVVIACLAGEEWRIDAFRDNLPIYLLSASKITGTPLADYLAYFEEHGEHHPHRQKIGKVNELACLTAQTQVLTERGYVDIVAVRESDKLWDGVEWVSHQGVIAKGAGAVMRLDGVEMTPTHKIICGNSWREARQLASSPDMLCRALASGSENLPSSEKKGATSWSFARAAPALMALRRPTFVRGKALGATSARRKKPAWRERSIGGTRILFPMRITVADYSTESPLASHDANREPQRRPMRTTGAGVFASIPRGLQTREVFSPTSSRCLGGTSHRLNLTESIRMETTSRGTFSSARAQRIRSTNAQSKKCSAESMALKPVYDIAYAGPRNRFTVRTNSGHLIVHNCGFGGWIGSSKAFGSTDTDEVIKGQILAWRDASPSIVELWGGQFRGAPWHTGTVTVGALACYGRPVRSAHAADPAIPEYFGYEGAAIQALLYPGQVFDVRGVKFQVRTTPAGTPALFVRLLSGRELTYHQARPTPATRAYSRPGEYAVIYMTWNSNPKYGPRGWIPMATYGGRLTENIVQATAHDVLRYAILNLRAAGYPTVLHVYDEIVVEVPHGLGSIEEVERIMSIMPPWAIEPLGRPWPIRAAGGWRGRRYRKG